MESATIFKPFYRDETGCAAYVFGCDGRGLGAVVDPQERDVEAYADHARAKGAVWGTGQLVTGALSDRIGRSVYRLWRDLGYAVGALLAGVTADLVDMARGSRDLRVRAGRRSAEAGSAKATCRVGASTHASPHEGR